MVYVISKNGQPLMPTKRYGKVHRLLKNKQAKVVKSCPFIIQLLYEPKTNIVQEVVLGQDTGSKHIGTACIANDKVLYQSQVELNDQIKSKMDRRHGFRRLRRSRKTRYRKPRFLNRKKSTRKNRLSPSVNHKVQAHKDEITFCENILPISKKVFEVSQFDTHLIKNPSLINERVRHWGYQKGFNYEYGSRKEAVLNRDNYTCQLCGKKHIRLEVHHIIFKSNGGTDDENNLITLCETCHKGIHDGTIKLDKKPKKMNLKHATHMSIIRSQLLKAYPEAIETLGFVTKTNRENLSLSKDHYIDACVIASGGKYFITNDIIYQKRRVSKGDYQLTKGSHGQQILPVGKVQGFRKFDKVSYLEYECFIKGKRSKGNFVLMDINNKTLDFSSIGGLKNPSYKKLKRVTARNSTLIKERYVVPMLG